MLYFMEKVMEKLNEQEFNFLKQYEDRLESASNSAYIRSMSSAAVHTMREIYSRLIGRTYSMNENCGGCILTLCRKLYKPYEEYKQSIEGNSSGRTTKSEQDTQNASGGEKQTEDPTDS